MTDVAAGKISLERVADATATRPARLFGLYPRKGAIRPGSDADIVLVDPKRKHTISDADVLSKCGWTPYAGREVVGIPVHTLLRGEAILDDGKINLREGFGRQATREPAAVAAR
jgi:dihydroorotase-like cyclic amidohydrolase